jgi:hypothetical protein
MQAAATVAMTARTIIPGLSVERDWDIASCQVFDSISQAPEDCLLISKPIVIPKAAIRLFTMKSRSTVPNEGSVPNMSRETGNANV